MTREEIFRLVEKERDRQDKIHPNWKGDHHGLSVLMEEVGETARALYELTSAIGDVRKSYWYGNLRDELIQVQAVCSRWLENFDD